MIEPKGEYNPLTYNKNYLLGLSIQHSRDFQIKPNSTTIGKIINFFLISFSG